MGFLSVATGVLGLVGAAQGIQQGFQGDQDIKDAQKAAGKQAGISTDAQRFALEVARGMVDPRDPRYQALIQESRDADFANLLMGHQQQAIEARRHQARGGLSTVSDRQDEAHQRSYRALDYPGVANQRRLDARAALEAASRAAGVGIQGAAAGMAGDLATANRNVEAGGFANAAQGIATADANLPSFESLFNQPAKVSTTGNIQQARDLPNVRLNSGPR